MHVREAAAHGLTAEYRLFDLDVLGLSAADLPHLLQQAQAEGFRGLNITHPCKQAVLAHVDEVSEHAGALGAVNTVVFSGGRRVGHNTDWWAFGESVRRGLPGASLERIALFGAGGAGAATAYAVLSMGAGEVRVVDPDDQRSASLASSMRAVFGTVRARVCPDAASALHEATGVIHATPTGMASYPGLPFPASLLGTDQWLAEVVYFPLETQLLHEARARGLQAIDGSGMAVYQAVQAFELFTGRPADAGRMRATFDSLGA
jgi:shikimate dehydrogenase